MRGSADVGRAQRRAVMGGRRRAARQGHIRKSAVRMPAVRCCSHRQCGTCGCHWDGDPVVTYQSLMYPLSLSESSSNQ